MEHLIYTSQANSNDFKDFWHNYMSDNFEIPQVDVFLHKKATYRELMLSPAQIYGQDEKVYFSSHPVLFKIRYLDEESPNDEHFVRWMHDVMHHAPAFFCVATSNQYLAGLFSNLFDDYIHYGMHQFFERLKILNQKFESYLHTEFFSHSFFDTPILDEDWGNIFVSDVLDEAMDTLGKIYEYQPYEAYPSAEEWYDVHRHDVIHLSNEQEMSLTI